MASGKVQLWEGKVLRDGGKVATHEDCCCHVCGRCFDDRLIDPREQDDVVVTVTGTCLECPPGEPVDVCHDAAGTYSFERYYWYPLYDPTECYWIWGKKTESGEWVLTLAHHLGVDCWCSELEGGTPDGGGNFGSWIEGNLCPGDFYGSPVVGITCNSETRKLSGAYDLGASDYGCSYTYCHGCTAHITHG